MVLSILPEEEGTFSITPVVTSPTYNPEYLDTKSTQFSAVLGAQSPGPDVIKNDINLGQEDRWSRLLAGNEQINEEKARMSLVQQVAENRDPNMAPTREEIDLVDSLTRAELYSPDPSTALARNYSKLFVNTASSIDSAEITRQAMSEDPEGTLDELDRAQFSAERLMIANDQKEQFEKRRADAGWVSTGFSWLLTAIPGYTNLMTRDAVKNAPAGSWLVGNNIQDQVSYLYSLPPNQFKSALEESLKNLEDTNPLLARDFIDAVISYSTSDRVLGNSMDIIDAASVIPVGKAAQVGKGFSKGIKATMKSPIDLAKQAGDLGARRTATEASVVQDMMKGDPLGVATLESLGPRVSPDLEVRLPSSMAPGRGFSEQLDIGSAAQNRAREAILRGSEVGKDLLSRTQLVDRMEPWQLEQASKEAFDTIKDIFTNVNHNIIDQEVIPASADKATNLYSVSVRFGQRDGTTFPTEKAAKNFVRRNISPKTNDYRIEQDGIGGYFVEIRRNISETGSVRDLEIPTEYKSPDRLMAKVFHGWRGADYELPQQNVLARGRVVHSSEFMAKELDKLTEPIKKVTGQARKDLEKVLRSNSINQKWLRTKAEFDAEFMKINGRAATKEQYDAYDAVTRVYDLDYLIRDADIVKQKARLGGERISFKMIDEKAPTGASGSSLKEFDGKVVDSFPWASKDPFTVRVVTDGVPEKELFSKYVGSQKRAELEALLQQGYKIALDPSESTYYVVRDMKRDRIMMGSLGYKEGGHHEYKFNHFIKQGDVTLGKDNVSRYKGDISLASAPTAEQASEVAKLLDQARLMVKNKDPNTKKFFDDNLSDFITMGEFMTKVKAGTIKLDVPILPVRKGQRTLDVSQYSKDIENFLDSTSNEHNIFGTVGGRYIGERDEYILDVLSAENNRIVKTTHDALLDPFETLRTSTGNLLDVRIVNDYRQKASADWVQEFGDIIDAPIQKVYANPLYYLQNAPYKQGADPQRIRVAENVRLRTLQLNNYKTQTEAVIQSYKDNLVDWAFNTKGERGREIMDQKVIPLISNGDTLMRAAAFHTKMGFFNVKHLFLQASEVAKIGLVSPVEGLQASRAIMLNRVGLLTDNQQALNGLANRWAKSVGFEKDEWLKMIDSFKRSGFSIVGHDQAYLDDISPRNFLTGGKTRQVLQAGTKFYEEGELISRNLAYTTAWREFRKRNPGREIDRYAESQILQRAKDLTTNMGRDSNAAWQRGYSAVVTQFMGYHARFMEQLWDGGLLSDGRKLTKAEKARVVFGMGALYGVPASAGAALPVWAWKDSIRQWMADEGVIYNDTALEPFMDGLLPTASEALFGTDFDWSGSYGPNGIPTFRDLLNGDKTWGEVLMGASGGILADTFKAAFGSTGQVVMDLGDLYEGGNNVSIRVLKDDLIEPFKNISTVNNSLKMWEAINTGRWISKSGTVLADDITVKEAIMGAAFGVTPDRVSDAYAKLSAKYDNDENRRKYLKEVRSWTSKGVQAANKGDMETARIYFSRAKSAAIRGGVSQSSYNSAVSDGLSDTPLTEKAEQTFQKFLDSERNIKENKY